MQQLHRHHSQTSIHSVSVQIFSPFIAINSTHTAISSLRTYLLEQLIRNDHLMAAQLNMPHLCSGRCPWMTMHQCLRYISSGNEDVFVLSQVFLTKKPSTLMEIRIDIIAIYENFLGVFPQKRMVLCRLIAVYFECTCKCASVVLFRCCFQASHHCL